MSDKAAIALSDVIAANIAALRVEQQPSMTQDDLALAVRMQGPIWNRSTVAQVETGRRKLTFVEAIAVAGSLGIPITQLVETDEPWVDVDAAKWPNGLAEAFILNDDNFERASELPRDVADLMQRTFSVALAGMRRRRHVEKVIFSRWELDSQMTVGEWHAIVRSTGSIERDVAAYIEQKVGLGVTDVEIVVASDSLWGRSFEVERDRRVDRELGSGDARRRQALRGRATRDMRTELSEAIDAAAERASERD